MNAHAQRRRFSSLGIPCRIVPGRKHAKVYVPTPDGERFVVLSSTPSDWRAERNTLARARRMMRGG
jgi:hypothetical protein